VTTAGKTVLIVDDDAHIREVVRFALAKTGFRVLEAVDGRAALALFASAPPDLVILDVLMPELDGTEVCRELRRVSRVPIIFLTSLDDEADRVIGLELGGDDYVAKPFSPRELVARVKAVLRRLDQTAPPSSSGGAPTDAAARSPSRGRLRLDVDLYQAFWDAASVPLTATEFHLLKALFGHPGKVYTRDELVGRALGDDVTVTERTIDSHVRRLRRKFAGVGADPIETVHGIGYKLGPCK
jgi:two-component system OmpR family response regulator